MPLIGLDEYKINFRIIPTNDLKTIALLDLSTYLGTPEKPLISVVLPGYTGSVDFTYVPAGIVIINSANLRLTTNGIAGYLADLPDGVYQITMKVCPYDELNSTMCYLKTSQLELDYQKLLLSVDVCGCNDEHKLKENIVDLDILIQSAKAEADTCNTTKAVTKYQAAVKKLASINKTLNCN